MMKKEGAEKLYQYICENQKGKMIVATLLSGKHAGEKLMLDNGKVIYSSCPGGILEDYIEKIKGIRKTCVLEGRCRVFCEPVGAKKEIVICGGGHVSIAVLKIAKMMGFFVTVLEDRLKFADDARRAGADRVICEMFEKGMEEVIGTSDTYFVIATRGHRYDSVCLECAVQKPNAYVGMMGSRRRVGIVLEQLEEKGIDKGLLERVYTPIGLPIMAETPEEIAVSVMAEIVQVKNKHLRSEGYSRELLKVLADPSSSLMPSVLATIVSRKGSAPRAVGTKMVIFSDGTQMGTIGGGCMEGAVLAKARLMIKEEAPEFQVVTVNMTAEEAQDAGMVCGGIEEVALERIG